MSVGLLAVLLDAPLFLHNGQGLTPGHTGLTGDNARAASALAAEVGITDVRAGLHGR
jgi:hypothetical protein